MRLAQPGSHGTCQQRTAVARLEAPLSLVRFLVFKTNPIGIGIATASIEQYEGRGTGSLRKVIASQERQSIYGHPLRGQW